MYKWEQKYKHYAEQMTAEIPNFSVRYNSKNEIYHKLEFAHLQQFELIKESLYHKITTQVLNKKIDLQTLNKLIQKIGDIHPGTGGALREFEITYRNFQFEKSYCNDPYAKLRLVEVSIFGFISSMYGVKQLRYKHFNLCGLCGEEIESRLMRSKHKLCKVCHQHSLKHKVEINRLNRALNRANKQNVLANLTLRQWLRCLVFFDNSCAYCGGKFECMEHIIPISKNGGTTVKNCLPACTSCNSIKNVDQHPNSITQNAIKKIQQYLSLPNLENPPFWKPLQE